MSDVQVKDQASQTLSDWHRCNPQAIEPRWQYRYEADPQYCHTLIAAGLFGLVIKTTLTM